MTSIVGLSIELFFSPQDVLANSVFNSCAAKLQYTVHANKGDLAAQDNSHPPTHTHTHMHAYTKNTLRL